YDHVWNILKDYSKWNATEPIDGDNLQELFGPDPREHPAGKQRAPEKQKSVDTSSVGGSTGRSTGGSQSESVSGVLSQDYRRKCDAAEKAYEAKREKELEMLQCRELKFLTIDHSSVEPLAITVVLVYAYHHGDLCLVLKVFILVIDLMEEQSRMKRVEIEENREENELMLELELSIGGIFGKSNNTNQGRRGVCRKRDEKVNKMVGSGSCGSISNELLLQSETVGQNDDVLEIEHVHKKEKIENVSKNMDSCSSSHQGGATDDSRSNSSNSQIAQQITTTSTA
nr:hypothetical protein [Tanacetum cinerariifolium]